MKTPSEGELEKNEMKTQGRREAKPASSSLFWKKGGLLSGNDYVSFPGCLFTPGNGIGHLGNVDLGRYSKEVVRGGR